MIAWRDVAVILGVVSAIAVVATGLAAWALHGLRRRPVRASLVVVSLTAALVTIGGTAIAGALMLVSGHALVVLVLVVVVATLAALAVASILGRALASGSTALGLAARRIGGEQPYTGVPQPATAELAGLAAELAVAHERLAESRDRERALEVSRRELVAWVSHDLRTPLAGVRAMSEALEDGVVDDAPTVAAYHRRIRLETERLAAMVDDLFELSRIHSGTLRLSVQEVALLDLVSDTLASTDPLAVQKGVRLAGYAQTDASAAVDVAQMARVLRNLVVNAIRHTPADGTVEVTCDLDASGAAVLAVSDGCGGIAEGDLPRLFEVGFRGETARSPGRDSGAGLGLAIARGIVHAHDGAIEVANVGDGCRFVVRLPRALLTTPTAPLG